MGENGETSTSADGITWTAGTVGTNDLLSSAHFLNGQFYALGGTSNLYSSGNGLNWTVTNLNSAVPLSDIAYGAGRYVIVGGNATVANNVTAYSYTILTSTDGSTWAQAASGAADNLTAVSYANNLFVATGVLGTIVTSPDGLNWTVRPSSATGFSVGSEAAYGGGIYALPGGAGSTTNAFLFTSPDGVTWTNQVTGKIAGINFKGVTAGNGIAVAVGTNGVIYRSADGTTWTQSTSGTGNALQHASYGAGLFVTVGLNGTILSSPDGTTWTSRTSGTATNLRGVNFSNGQFIAVGDSGTVLSSPDGVTWTSRTASSGTTQSLYATTYGCGYYVAVGTNGVVIESANGINWASHGSFYSGTLDAVTYANGTLVAVGSSGMSVYSTDGSFWSTHTLTTDNLSGVTYAGGNFIALGTASTYYASPNGVNWTGLYDGSADALNDLAVYGSQVIAVGNNTAILAATAPAAAEAPVITSSSLSSGLTATAGENVTFSATAAGLPAPTYQWQVLTPNSIQWTNLSDGAGLTGSATGTLTVSGVGLGQAGTQYRVVVNNSQGSATSSASTLSVSPAAAWSFTTVAGFAFRGSADGTGPAAQFNNAFAMAVDASGNVYVADENNQTIRLVTPAGVVTTFAGAAGLAGSVDGPLATARFNIPGALALDNSGNLYVADRGDFTIRKIVLSTGIVSTVAGLSGQPGTADGTGSVARFNAVGQLAVDGSGNVYATDEYNHTIRVITPAGVVTTLAGSPGQAGYADGSGSAALFNEPSGIAVDSSGNVYVSERLNYTVRKITPSGVVTTIAGTAGLTGATDSPSGPGSAARFKGPFHMSLDSTNGILYLADGLDYAIRKIVISTGAVTTIAGKGISGYLDGVGTAAIFGEPVGTALDASGNLYITDIGNQDIRKLVLSTGNVSTVAGGTGNSDGPGSAARFNGPRYVSVDSSGNLYVADSLNHTIRQITAGGAVSTLAGQAGLRGSTDAAGTAAQFNTPSCVVPDGGGNLYVADTGNNTIRKIVISGGVVSTIAGTAGSSGTADGIGTAARFNGPRGLLLDGSGNLYVSDSGSNTIRKIVLSSGAVSTVAGSAGFSGAADGTSTGAQFSSPQQMALSTDGKIYIADSSNYAIRQFNPATGAVSTVLGQSGVIGYNDGPAKAALFNFPYGIAFDGQGNAYVTDVNNDLIRMVTPSGVVTTIGGLSGVSGSTDGTGAAARFYAPYGVTVDSSGNLYIADFNNNTIRKGTIVAGPPVLNAVPTTQLAPLGSTVRLSVSAVGATAYQWQLNGVNITGATASSYVIASLQSSSVGLYTVVVSNAGGSITTRPVAVDITGDPNGYTIDPSFSRPQFKRGPVNALRALYDGNGGLLVTFSNDGFELNGASHQRMDGILRLNATTGALDTGFSASPVVSNAWGIAVQADGKVLVGAQTVGDQSGTNGNQYFRIVRYYPNGAVDSAYHSVVIQGIGRWMTVQPDGKLLLSCGATTVFPNGGVNALSLVRLNADGTLDSSFASPTLAGGNLGGQLFAPPVVDANGKILIGGGFTTVNSVARPSIARLNSNGSLDTSFAPSGFLVPVNGRVRGIGIQSTGKIVVAGGNFNIGGAVQGNGAVAGGTNYCVVRLNPADGSLDPTFTLLPKTTLGFAVTGSSARAEMMKLLPDDRIALVDTSVVQLSANGAIDPTFTPAVLSGEAYWLDVMPNNQIVVSAFGGLTGSQLAPGQTITVNGTPVSGLFRINTNGTLDTTFTPAPFEEEIFPSLGLVQSDNRIVVLGAFTEVNGIPRNGTVRFNLDGSIDTSFADPVPSAAEPIFQPVSAGLSSDGRIYTVAQAGADPASANPLLVRINTNGTRDTGFTPAASLNLGNRMDLNVTVQGAQPVLFGVDPQDVVNGAPFLKRLNADGTVDTSFVGFTGTLGAVNRVSGAIDNIFAGSVHVLTPISGGGFLASVTTGAYPTLDTSTGVISGTYSFTLVKLNANGSLAGGFSAPTAGGIGVNQNGLPNGVVTDPLNGNASVDTNATGDGSYGPLGDPFSTAAVLADGSVVAAGTFTTLGAQAVPGIVKLTPAGAIDSTFNVGTGPQITKVSGDQARIDKIRVDSTGKLVITGDFDTFNGQPANGIVRLVASTGAVDTSVVTDVSYYDYDQSTTSLLPLSDGSAYLFGLYRGASDTWPFGLTHLAGGLPPVAAPAFTVQPVSDVDSAGNQATFTVAVTGYPQPALQWYLNGAPIAGATGLTLSVNVQPSSTGVYTVTATNSQGTVRSSPATLGVGNKVLSVDPSLSEPYYLATDGTSLFVTSLNSNAADPNRNSTSRQSIFRLPLGGGAVTSLYPAYNPLQLAVTGGKVFWIDPNSGPVTDTQVFSAPSAGGGSVSAIYTGSSVGQPIVDGSGMATDGTLLYAADEVNGSVWSMHTDGTALTQIGPNRYSGGSSTERLNTLAVSQGTIYVADSGGGGGTPAILSIPTNGSSFTTLASGAPLVSPAAIAVGNGMIYVSDPGANNTLWQIPIGGGTPVALFSNTSGANIGHLAGIVYSGGTLYVADSGAGTIYGVYLAAPGLPAITTQPQSQSVPTGASVTFTAAASGTPAPTYQWYFNGTPIAGATSASYTLNNAQYANNGNYSVEATNSVGTVGSNPASLTVNVTISSSLTASGVAQASFLYQILASGGAGSLTYSAAGLPTGLAVNPATGQISGTTTQSGTFTVVLTATDQNGNSGHANLALTIASFGVTSSLNPIGIKGVSFSYQVLTSGGTGPYTYAATGLPAGLTLNASTGQISGTPTQTGVSSVTLTVTDSSSPVKTAQATLQISATALGITSSSSAIAIANLAFTLQVTAAGGAAPYTYAATGLPTGLGINTATGAITGTPTQTGLSTVTLTATDSANPTNTAQQQLQIAVNAFGIPSPLFATGALGTAFTLQIPAAGGATPYTYTATGLPTGLSINASTGAITGTPAVSGVFTVSLGIADSSSPGLNAQASLNLTITSPPGISAQPHSQTLVAGTTATFTVAATGVPAPAYRWYLNGVALTNGTQADGSVVSGATSSTLTISGTTGSESAGAFTVAVGNSVGTVTSSPAVLSLRPASAGASTFTGTGDLPGGAFSSAVRATTEDGQIAVGSGSVLNPYPAVSSGDRPFIWTSTNGIRELPEPVNVTNGTLFLTASDITPDGSVIAGRVRKSATANQREPAIWTNGGKTLTVIPDIAGYNNTRGAAVALSSDGSVVYGWSNDTVSGRWQGYRWTAATGTVGLGFLNPTDGASMPVGRGVSADGSTMVGQASSSTGNVGGFGPGQTAFIYTTSGGMHSLGYLPGGAWSQPTGITSDGTKVLGLADSPGYPNGQYVTWTLTGGSWVIAPMGVADPYDVNILGGITSDGLVTAGGGYVHNPNGFMNVKQVIAAAGFDTAGWSQLQILGISRNGNVLSGQALDPSGYYEGWVATFPANFLKNLVLAASISNPPAGQTAIAGGSAQFTAGTSGGPGLAARWYLNGAALADGPQSDGTVISGSATNALSLSNIALSRSGGSYTIRVTDSASNTATSPAAILTVTPAAQVTALVSADPKLTMPGGLASDGTYLYVAGVNSNVADPIRNAVTGGAIFRVPLVGGAATPLYAASAPQQLAVLGGNVDWIDPQSGTGGTTQVLQAAKAGGGTVAAILSQPSTPVVNGGDGLATDGTSLYLTEQHQGTLYKMNADGTGLTQLGSARYPTDGDQPNSVAVSAGTVYIADSGQGLTPPDVVSVPESGSNTFTTLYNNSPSSVFSSPLAIAVGNGMVYVADQTFDGSGNPIASTIWEMPLSGGTPAALVTGPSYVNITGLVFANGALYASDTGTGRIYQILVGGAAAAAPAITVQPASVAVSQGQITGFTVVATGVPTPTFQWNFNGTAISGATSPTLSIPNAQAGNAGSYTVVVTNSSGSVTSSAAVLTINSAPQITLQPAASQTVTVGGSAAFAVTATGSPAPTFQWKKNGTAISGATASSYTINPVALTDSGSYSVVASNSVGTATSSVAALIVNSAPTITSQPAASLTLNQGQTATLSVGAAGVPAPTFQWQIQTAPSTWVNLSGATGPTLSFPNVQGSSSGTYRVVITNSVNSVASNPETLTVNTLPVFTTQPASQTLTAGQPVSFTAVATGIPTPTYQWQKNGANITGATNSTYTVASAQAGDAGTYTAVATNSVGSATSAPALLGVNTAPAITTQPVSQTVLSGANATFTVAASGIPAVTYQWSFNGTPLSDGAGVSGSATSTLTLTGVGVGSAGSYTATASNGVGTPATSNAATLTVNVLPVLLTTPANQSVTVGAGSVTFSASASGTPAPTFQWRKNGLNIAGATSSSLTLTNIQLSDAGTYTVIATNAASSVSASATLTVSAPPTITAQPISTTVNAGQNVSFTVAASGVPNTFTYQWQKGGSNISGATAATLSLPSVTSGSAGNYTVIVSNGINPAAASNIAVLTVNTAPTISVQPATQTVTAGGSVTFSVTAGGNPAPTYQWTKNGSAIAGATSSSLILNPVTLTSAGNYAVIVSNSVGSVSSSVAPLIVNSPPALTLQPQSQSVGTGTNVTFTTAATGYPAPSFQWQKGGTNISGATAATLTLSNVALADAGTYTVIASNGIGSAATSNAAILTVSDSVTISTQPQSQTITAGASVTFTVIAGGTAPLTYQWQKGGTAIPGATNSTYTIAAAQTSDSGAYAVVVSNAAGSVTSSTATLTVNPAPVRGLVEGSGRSFIATSGAAVTGSFTVEGLASKQMLIRAVGPALATYGLTGVLTNPQLEIDNAATGAVVATNSGWSAAANAAQIATVSTQVGAFALTSGSADAAVLANFAPGTYNVKVTGASGTTGAVLLEVYDADTTPRLVYLSTEAQVGQGNRILIEGFIVNSLPSGRSYLIRALGPALGTPGALATPQLTIYNSGGSAVASNAGWNNNASLATLAASIGAQPLAAGSLDAAINFTPASAGAYTVQVTGVGASTGLALLEIIEVDSQRVSTSAPAITAHPVSISVPAGQPATFGVVAVANPAPSYQWLKGGTAITGATSAQLSIASIQGSDAGSYSVTVTNSAGSATSSAATLTVLAALAAPTITTQPASATVVQGQTATFAVAASGNPSPTYQWYFNGAAIPGETGTALTIANAQFGSAGNYTVTVANSLSSVTSAAASLTVNPTAPVITSPLTANAVMGASFGYLIATNPTATSFTAVGLPAGLTLGGSGNIGGTPTVAGTFNVAITAANVTGAVSATLVLTVQTPPPVITSAAAASGQVGSSFTYTTQASNSPTSYSITSGTLPAGLALDPATGIISGTPTQSGYFSVTLTVANGTGSVSLPLSLAIAPAPLAPVFNGNAAPSGTQGTAFSYTPSFANNVAGYALVNLADGVTPSTLPTGLTFAPATGIISGTPTQVGTFNLALQATGSGGSAVAYLILTVNPAPTAPKVTSASTATATVGAAFSYATTVSTPATSYGATGLPSGLAIDAGTGVISGTPVGPGTYNIGITATNAVGTGPTALLILTINPSPNAPVITSSASVAGTAGSAFSFQVSGTNAPTSFTITAGTLPAGLALDTAGGGISGTPSQAGSSTVWIAAANASGLGSSLGVLFTILPAPTTPVITSNGTASGQVGQPFNYAIIATNSPTSYAASGLPTGLALDASSGLITGIPGSATSQPISISMTATNAGGTGNAKTLLLSIAPAPATPVITSALTAGGQVGSSFSYQMTASNSPTSFVATSLPPGLSVNPSTGLISGAPTQAGTFTVSLQAGNVGGLGATSSLVATIASAPQAPAITSSAAATGQVGLAFSYQAVASPGPITGYSETGSLPPGLTFNTSTGLLSGNPANPGLYSVSLTAINVAGASLPQALLIAINPAANVPVVTSGLYAIGTVGVAFNFTLTASNMPATTPYPASVTLDAVNLPPGLGVNPSTGVISGSPTQAGTFLASAVGTNANGQGPISSLTIIVQPAPSAPVVNSGTSTAAQVGAAFAYQITATNSPSSYQILGAPAWMTVNNQTGIISGVPDVPGTVSVQMVASNAGGDSSPVTLAVTVAPAAGTPIVTSSQTASGQIGSAFSYQIAATGSPSSFLATGLPSGLGFNTSTGLISGTPTSSGTYPVLISAVNANGQGGAVTVTVTIQSSLQLGF